MLRSFARLTPSLVALTFVLGSAAPALADVAPRRKHKKSTLEPNEAPPMEDPAEPSEVEAPPEAEPEAEPAAKTEAKPEPEPEPEAQAEPEPEPEPQAEPEAKTKTESRSCSVTDDPERGLIGLAALVVVISGAGLRRRRP